MTGDGGAGDRRQLFGWSLYAWANHSFVTAVGTVLIGPFLLSLATHAAGKEGSLFGWGPLQVTAPAYASFVVTVSVVAQVFLLPLLGATADAIGHKRRLLAAGCLVGSVLTALLAASGAGSWLFAGLVFVVLNVVFGASDVIYNAFLPELVDDDHRDRVSSKGFAYGYVGGGLMLAVDLALLQLHGALGMSQGLAVRVCFVLAGAWWAAFGLVALRRLPARAARRSPGHRVGTGVRELWATLRLLRTMPQTARYLVAYLFFSDAISAILALSSTYITHELYDDNATKAAPFLFSLILMIQFVAMAGSLVSARLAARFGTKRTIMAQLVVWVGVVVYAYAALHSPSEALVMGVVIALVMGGSQALSRSLYSQMVPKGREATFFGLYEICDRGTSWMAPLVFTVVVSATGSFRQAILTLIAFFVVGLVTLGVTDVRAARLEAAAAPVIAVR